MFLLNLLCKPLNFCIGSKSKRLIFANISKRIRFEFRHWKFFESCVVFCNLVYVVFLETNMYNAVNPRHNPGFYSFHFLARNMGQLMSHIFFCRDFVINKRPATSVWWYFLQIVGNRRKNILKKNWMYFYIKVFTFHLQFFYSILVDSNFLYLKQCLQKDLLRQIEIQWKIMMWIFMAQKLIINCTFSRKVL